MKRILAALLAVTTLFMFSACESSDPSSGKKETSSFAGTTVASQENVTTASTAEEDATSSQSVVTTVSPQTTTVVTATTTVPITQSTPVASKTQTVTTAPKPTTTTTSKATSKPTVTTTKATQKTGVTTTVNKEETLPEPSEPFYFEWRDGTLFTPGINGGYPRLYALKNGTMLLGYDGMYVAQSTNDGGSWSRPVRASQNYPGTANANFYQTADGTVYLGFRSTEYRSDGSFYSSIQISYSTDNGKSWKHHSTVYENVENSGEFRGVWEPHLGMMNGYLTCFYANDSTSITAMQNIEYKQWDPVSKEWINRTIVSNGVSHRSRDGMPVWQPLSTGGYVCVIEAFDKENNDRFAIKLTYSKDGKNWTTPVTVMSPTVKGAACAAPYVVELPTGQLVISCQTNETTGGGDLYCMATVISDGTHPSELTESNFSQHDYPFYDNSIYDTTMWNGMYIHKNYIYAISISSNKGIRINRFDFSELL